MKAVRTRHIFYHEDSNRLVLIPSLKRMIELEEMKVMIMMKMVVPSLIVSFEKSDQIGEIECIEVICRYSEGILTIVYQFKHHITTV